MGFNKQLKQNSFNLTDFDKQLEGYEMNSMGFNKATSIRVVKLVMQETGTYNPQFIRPYTTNVDGKVVETLVDRVMGSTNRKIDGSMLSGLASAFITPQAAPESQVNMINGWDTKRIRFTLEVICDNALGVQSTEYVQGYTSHSGITNNMNIDPDMDFFINSITQTRKQHIPTPVGIQVIETIVDNSHILADNNWQGITTPNQQRMLRPQDVFCNISHNHIPYSFENDGDRNINGSGIFDARTVMKMDATKSRRRNGLGGAFAADIMSAYTTSTQLAEFGQNEDSLVEAARANVVEQQASIDPFLSAISNITQGVVSNRFRMSHLMRLDPNIVNVINYAITGPTQMSQVHQMGQTNHWQGSDRITQAAVILSQSLPAIMMDLMINSVYFKSTNHDITGQPTTIILTGKGFTNMDQTRHFDLFKHRLEREIINDMTFGNQSSYNLEVKANLLGETWITIAIDNSGSFDFVTPSYCDNLFVPVITRNPEVVRTLASDFESLNAGIKDAMGNLYNQQTFSNFSNSV